MKLGLALGGGAVLGFAHLGALKVLAEADVRPAAIAGTSAGSVFGALFCAGLSCGEIEAASEKISWLNLISPAIPSLGILKSEGLEKTIDKLTGGILIEDMIIPFRAVASDLITGRQAVFAEGPAGRAVRASCAIPGLFMPVDDGERLLVDGGLVNNVPCDVVRAMGADYVIGIDVITSYSGKKPSGIGEVVFRSMMILLAGANFRGASQADLIIAPELSQYSPQDMSKKTEIIAAGEAAMRAALTKLPRRF